MATDLLAGFADVDITPRTLPVRAYRALAHEVLDPLYAHAAAFRCRDAVFAAVSLDVVIVESGVVEAIRRRRATTVSRSCPRASAFPIATLTTQNGSLRTRTCIATSSRG